MLLRLGKHIRGTAGVLRTLVAAVALLALPSAEADDDLADVIERAERSVVRFDVKSATDTWLGSGFVIESSGVIMTNHHVMAGATTAKVTFQNGRSYDVVGTKLLDAAQDIAIVKINATDLPVLELVSVLPRKGDIAIALGAPHGLSFSASQGIISAIRDLSAEANEKEIIAGTLLQTTAPISPGNSGGPLINSSGWVVGMNTLVFTIGQNLNFAIPATRLVDAVSKQASAAVIPLTRGAAREKSRSDEERESEISDEALQRYVADAERLFNGLKTDLNQRLKQTNERLSLYKRGKTEMPPQLVASEEDVHVVVDFRNRETAYFRNPIVKSKAVLELSERAEKLKTTLAAIVNPDRKQALFELVRQAGPPLDVREIGDIGFLRDPTVISVFEDKDILLATLSTDERTLLVLRGEPTDRLRVGDQFDSLPLYISGLVTIQVKGRELPVLLARRVPESRLAQAIFGNEHGSAASSESGLAAGHSTQSASSDDLDIVGLFAVDAKQARLWSDASGKFRVEAEYVSQDARQVILRRTDTKTLLTVPKARLSRADQEFLRHAQ